MKLKRKEKIYNFLDLRRKNQGPVTIKSKRTQSPMVLKVQCLAPEAPLTTLQTPRGLDSQLHSWLILCSTHSFSPRLWLTQLYSCCCPWQSSYGTGFSKMLGGPLKLACTFTNNLALFRDSNHATSVVPQLLFMAPSCLQSTTLPGLLGAQGKSQLWTAASSLALPR